MKLLKKITILLCFLSLIAFVSCSAEDKTGVKNNPPENDTEIKGGGTGSGSGGSSETGSGSGSDSGSETGGSGTGGSGTGGDSGSGSGSGSGEGGGGTVTPPSEPETIEEIEAKYFPTDLLGQYRDENVASAGYSGANFNTKVFYDETTKKTKIEGIWLEDGATSGQGQNFSIEKWKQTKKGGNPIKLEGESSDSGGGKYTIIYDYASGTLSGTYTHTDGTWSFNGKKIS